MGKKQYRYINLFGQEEIKLIEKKTAKVQQSLEDYDGFIEKFQAKKTTDDCYTPPAVYETILKFVSDHFDLSNCQIIRPFYPDGDYKNIEYKDNYVVVDNPPFSIITEIAKFYLKNNIKFFLFAPHLTLFTADMKCTYIVCGASVIYENGANVKTSFLSNLFGDTGVIGASTLCRRLNYLNKKVELPKYRYPANVLTVSAVQWIIERGIDFRIERSQMRHIRQLEDQKKHGKTLFGSGFILSDKAAADKAAADKAAADKAAADKAAADTVMLFIGSYHQKS